MHKLIRPALVALALVLAVPAAAQAQCFADYKAKRVDGSLRLSYGVIEVSEGACGNKRRARAEIEARISRDGWQLLNVMSFFGPEGLDQRRGRAGADFLRY